MKEQLAKMTIIELVRTAHSYSTSIKQTGVYSELVREMGSRLEAINLAHIGAMAALNSTEKERDQLAAECAVLKESRQRLGQFIHEELEADYPLNMHIETPATDRFLAEQRAQAHKAGAYFVANRMLAAWEAGFIDDTAKNAADIARMILTSTEFMADAPEGDFDRSFADGVLKDIAAQLRNEVKV